jgi:hypothetical protein
MKELQTDEIGVRSFGIIQLNKKSKWFLDSSTQLELNSNLGANITIVNLMRKTNFSTKKMIRSTRM